MREETEGRKKIQVGTTCWVPRARYHMLDATCWARCITKQPRDLGVKGVHLPLAGEGSGPDR